LIFLKLYPIFARFFQTFAKASQPHIAYFYIVRMGGLL